MTTVPQPPGLKGASILNVLFGAVYALMGGMQFATKPNPLSFVILVSGLAAVVGSFGLLYGRRWALRFATLGLTTFVIQNTIVTLVLAAIAWGSPAGAFFAGAFGFGTLLQAFTLYLLRRPSSADYVWAVTESELPGGVDVLDPVAAVQDEVVFVFEESEVELEADETVQGAARS